MKNIVLFLFAFYIPILCFSQNQGESQIGTTSVKKFEIAFPDNVNCEDPNLSICGSVTTDIDLTSLEAFTESIFDILDESLCPELCTHLQDIVTNTSDLELLFNTLITEVTDQGDTLDEINISFDSLLDLITDIYTELLSVGTDIQSIESALTGVVVDCDGQDAFKVSICESDTLFVSVADSVLVYGSVNIGDSISIYGDVSIIDSVKIFGQVSILDSVKVYGEIDVNIDEPLLIESNDTIDVNLVIEKGDTLGVFEVTGNTQDTLLYNKLDTLFIDYETRCEDACFIDDSDQPLKFSYCEDSENGVVASQYYAKEGSRISLVDINIAIDNGALIRAGCDTIFTAPIIKTTKSDTIGTVITSSPQLDSLLIDCKYSPDGGDGTECNPAASTFDAYRGSNHDFIRWNGSAWEVLPTSQGFINGFVTETDSQCPATADIIIAHIDVSGDTRQGWVLIDRQNVSGSTFQIGNIGAPCSESAIFELLTGAGLGAAEATALVSTGQVGTNGQSPPLDIDFTNETNGDFEGGTLPIPFGICLTLDSESSETTIIKALPVASIKPIEVSNLDEIVIETVPSIDRQIVCADGVEALQVYSVDKDGNESYKFTDITGATISPAVVSIGDCTLVCEYQGINEDLPDLLGATTTTLTGGTIAWYSILVLSGSIDLTEVSTSQDLPAPYTKSKGDKCKYLPNDVVITGLTADTRVLISILK